MKLPSTGWLIRFAVILVLVGLVLLVPILLEITATGVGLYMLGSLLIVVAIVLYIVAVVRELRRKKAL